MMSSGGSRSSSSQNPQKNASSIINNEQLKVSKVELTSGNQTGEVYIQLSEGSAFLLTDRREAIKFVEKKATVSK